jgi:hypothetical protein
VGIVNPAISRQLAIVWPLPFLLGFVRRRDWASVAFRL